MLSRVHLRVLVLGATLLAGLPWTLAGVLLEPIEAPEWKVDEWINGNPGRLADQRGKVVLIDFFQLWCPGSNEFSLPLFEKWARTFGSRDDVLVVSIHTVFEGHDQQTPEHLRRFIEEKGITHPVGIDVHRPPDAPVPVTMDRYETGGTPHVAIVDKEGQLRFSHFGRFDPEPVERFIERLLEEDKKLNVKSTPRDEVRSKKQRPTPRRGSRDRTTQTQPPLRPERVDDPEEPEAEPYDYDTDAVEPDDAAGVGPGDASGDEIEGAPDSDSGDEEEPQESPDRSLSGSYKLRFEQLSKTCGEISAPVEVITQVSVREDQIVAQFSRSFLGIRQLTVDYDAGSGGFEASAQQQGTERGGVQVDLSLQLSGRFVSITDPPELEYEYYVDERSEDGTFDCTIEGRGGGPRFRAR